jgi:ElaB/YqjD/DUF883 family membrane-anchored ribosome-binding protein
MGESADQIRNEIDMNRRSAEDKINQIQTQVENTTQQLRTGVQDSAQEVREQIKGTIDETVETVKQGVDVRRQVDERPLMAVGAALIGGFVLGGLMGGNGSNQGQHSTSASHSGSSGSSMGQGIRSAMQKSGLDETVTNAASALIASVTDQLRDTLDRNFPGFADKMQTAQHTSGDLANKTRQAQTTQV